MMVWAKITANGSNRAHQPAKHANLKRKECSKGEARIQVVQSQFPNFPLELQISSSTSNAVFITVEAEWIRYRREGRTGSAGSAGTTVTGQGRRRLRPLRPEKWLVL